MSCLCQHKWFPFTFAVCREWTTVIDYRLKEDKLIVEFEQGPSRCNIKMYDIKLYGGHLEILKEATINSSKVCHFSLFQCYTCKLSIMK